MKSMRIFQDDTGKILKQPLRKYNKIEIKSMTCNGVETVLKDYHKYFTKNISSHFTTLDFSSQFINIAS